MKAITQSMLGMFLRCPHQFERRYLRGEIIPPGIAARRGSATHKAAQLNHEQKLHTKEDLPVSDLQDAARDHYVKQIKEEGVFIPKDQVAEKERLLGWAWMLQCGSPDFIGNTWLRPFGPAWWKKSSPSMWAWICPSREPSMC
jgi:hypothetical protein